MGIVRGDDTTMSAISLANAVMANNSSRSDSRRDSEIFRFAASSQTLRSPSGVCLVSMAGVCPTARSRTPAVWTSNLPPLASRTLLSLAYK